MPKRIVSHQTGSGAVKAFNSLIPDLWVVREKDSDYGVDLEVELFDPDGHDTGLMLLVQSKGTEKEQLETSISIKVETLKYLVSFDAPAIIYRHSIKTGRSYWMWVENALNKAKPNTKTVTIKFSIDNIWDEFTLDEIWLSLIYLRIIRERKRGVRFPIYGDLSSNANEQNAYAEFMRPFWNEISFCKPTTEDECVPIQVSIIDNIMTLSILKLFSVSMELASDDKVDKVACLSYLVCKLLYDLDFDRHAERISAYCLDFGHQAPNRELANKACISLLDKPNKAVELAIRNNLHSLYDENMALFALALRMSIDVFDENDDAVISFFKASIHSQETEHDIVGSLSYTLGNFLRSKRRYAEAVSAYNYARKSDVDYLNRTYFHKELGGILFLSGHFKYAEKSYKRLIEIEDVPEARLLLGDTLFFQSKFTDVVNLLDSIKNDETSIGCHAYLQIEFSNWCISKNIEIMYSDYDEILNLRSVFLEKKDVDSAFWIQLYLSFYNEDDEESWSDTIFLCMISNHRSILNAVLAVASKMCGIAAYLQVKRSRKEFFDNDPQMLAELDRLAFEINSNVEREPPYIPGETINESKELAQKGVLRFELGNRL